MWSSSPSTRGLLPCSRPRREDGRHARPSPPHLPLLRLFHASKQMNFYQVLFFLFLKKLRFNNLCTHHKINHFKFNDSVAFSTFGTLCTHHHHLIPDFSSSPNDTTCPLASALPPLPQPALSSSCLWICRPGHLSHMLHGRRVYLLVLSVTCSGVICVGASFRTSLLSLFPSPNPSLLATAACSLYPCVCFHFVLFRFHV